LCLVGGGAAAGAPGGEDVGVGGEGGWGEFSFSEEADVVGFGAGGELAADLVEGIHDEDHRVVGAGEDTEEVVDGGIEAGLFADFTDDGVVELFAAIDEAAGESPGAHLRLVVAVGVEETALVILNEGTDGDFGVLVVDVVAVGAGAAGEGVDDALFESGGAEGAVDGEDVGHGGLASGRLAGEDDAVEAFVVATVGVTPAGADVIGEAFRALAELGVVFEEGFDFDVEDVGDVDSEVGVVVAPEVDLADVVGFEAVVGEVLGEVEMVAGGGVDGVDGHGAGVAVVAVVNEALEFGEFAFVAGGGGAAVDDVGGVGEDGVGLEPADVSDDVAEHGATVVKFAVFAAEEGAGADAEDLGAGFLFLLAEGDETLAGHVAVAGAFGAVGEDEVVEFPFAMGPEGNGAARAKVGVVRVGADDESDFLAVALW